MQGDLFQSLEPFQSLVISRRADFDGLFDGFTSLRAVSYVVSPELLLDFFDRGYERLEVLVGENLSEPYRQALAQKGLETSQRLCRRVCDGSLRILVPERTVHTKLYLLERPGICRVIASSANLTETARRAASQVNYAWYADLPADHPWLKRVEGDYQAHLKRSALFMGDLKELLEKRRRESPASGEAPEAADREILEAWLKGAVVDEADLETRRVLREISTRAMEPVSGSAEPVFTVSLPEAPVPRRQAERILAPLEPVITGHEARVSGPGYIRFVQENHGVPLLHVDLARRELRLGIDGSVRSLTEPLPEAARVAEALRHLEEYFETVDSGQAPDPGFAKASMCEALLYVLSAPFANEVMRLKRSRYGAIDSRGPRFLYIYGPSQNGKSTFLRFALKLITGRLMEPLSGGEFAKRRLAAAAAVGTAFPLAFDDVVLAQRAGLFEDVLKSYWEVWWREDCVSPQIMLSSNAYTLKEWAKSRVDRVDFDVHFVPTGPGKETLARLFRYESPLFKWFSHLYLQRLEAPDFLAEDELSPARGVLEALYRHAGLPMPAYFPRQPIEKLYDPGRRAWRDLLDRLGKARVQWDKDRASVHFSDDMQHYEIKEYEGHLPQLVKHRRRGKALLIETPAEFRSWLYGDSGKPAGWWSRLFSKRA